MRLARGLAAALVGLLAAGGVARADLRAFKQAWAAAAQAAEGEARREARLAALTALPAGDDPAALKLLCGLALDLELDPSVREAAEGALARQRGPAVSAALAAALGGPGQRPKEKRPERRVVLCRVLGPQAAEDEGARTLLIGALADPEPSVALAALGGLRNLRHPEVVGALVGRLQTAEGRLAADLGVALRRLTGSSCPDPAAWKGWWEARGGALTPPDASAEPEPARTVTRTELAPPAGGRTIYGEVASSRVLFVLDISGSMRVPTQDSAGASRSRLDYVRDSLLGVIREQLAERDEFSLLAFSSEVQTWSRKLLPASEANKKKAASWLARLEPQGGTNIYLALERAFQIADVDTIYFLSDGSPSEGTSIVTSEIVGRVRSWNSGRGVRLEAIGFLAGDGAPIGVSENKGMAKRFLEALAEHNDGSARFFE